MHKITIRGTGYEVKIADEQDVGKQLANHNRVARMIGDKAAKVLFINVRPAEGSESIRVDSSMLLIHFYWTKDVVKVGLFAELERALLASTSGPSRWEVEKRLWMTLTNQRTEYLNHSGVGNRAYSSFERKRETPLTAEEVDEENFAFYCSG